MPEHPVSGQEIWAWYQRARQQAQEAGVPLHELDWLLQSLSSIERLGLRLGTVQFQPEVNLERSLSDLEMLWQQRLVRRVPVQYLVGQTAWRTFSLRVTPAVLIPRPETELIIDRVSAFVQTYPRLAVGHWADLGTGSGAIALGLAAALPEALIHAVDQSSEAIALAQDNAQRNHLGDRIRFYSGSWFEPLQAFRGQLSGMVSNPPYIPTALIGNLPPEVATHEPHLALDGGQDGLNSIRHLVQAAPRYVMPGGFWMVELMAGQAPQVAALLAETGQYTNIQIHSDLAGIERFVSGVLAGEEWVC